MTEERERERERERGGRGEPQERKRDRGTLYRAVCVCARGGKSKRVRAAFRLDILLAAIRGWLARRRGNPVYSYFAKYWGVPWMGENDSSERSSARRACKLSYLLRVSREDGATRGDFFVYSTRDARREGLEFISF